jgi:hypothetical protein
MTDAEAAKHLRSVRGLTAPVDQALQHAIKRLSAPVAQGVIVWRDDDGIGVDAYSGEDAERLAHPLGGSGTRVRITKDDQWSAARQTNGGAQCA